MPKWLRLIIHASILGRMNTQCTTNISMSRGKLLGFDNRSQATDQLTASFRAEPRMGATLAVVGLLISFSGFVLRAWAGAIFVGVYFLYLVQASRELLA